MNQYSRGFARVKGYENVKLPERKTTGSAGYDIDAAEGMEFWPGETLLVPTGLKAYMYEGEYLQLAIRSSLAVKRGLTLINGVGIIDQDYADNPDNEGHIMLAIHNTSIDPQRIEKGERVAQGIFLPYYIGLCDNARAERKGGFGSTNEGS